jgi:hypothetical protein
MWVATPHNEMAVKTCDVDASGQELDNAIDQIKMVGGNVNVVHGLTMDRIRTWGAWKEEGNKFAEIGPYGIGYYEDDELVGSGDRLRKEVHAYCEDQEALQQLLLLSKTLIGAADNYFDLFVAAATVLAS